MRIPRLKDIDDDTLIRALTDPDPISLDDTTGAMKDLSRVSDDDLARALRAPDLVELR